MSHNGANLIIYVYTCDQGSVDKLVVGVEHGHLAAMVSAKDLRTVPVHVVLADGVVANKQ